MAHVSVKQLDITYGHSKVIDGLDLEIESGEFLVLLGPSGCGKSTLLNALGGLIDSSGGQICFDQRDVTWEDPKDRGIGMVFQSYALYPTMTVRKNMSFGLKIAGMPKREIEAKVEWAAKLLQLEALLERKPGQLSGGQRQRVAIGRALVRKAGVYLFDEPLSNLDAKLRAELRLEIKKLHRELGSTMVYVTHDQIEAMTLASRIAVMKDGIIQQLDTPTRVYRYPANRYVAGFVGSPEMNFLEGHIDLLSGEPVFHCNRFRLSLAQYQFEAKVVDGQAVTLGIRPEHISIMPPQSPQRLPGQIRLVEPMGAETLIWASLDGEDLSILTDSNRDYEAGEILNCQIDGQRLSVFDGNSGQRL